MMASYDGNWKISLIWLKAKAGVSLRSLIKTGKIVLGVRWDGRGS